MLALHVRKIKAKKYYAVSRLSSIPYTLYPLYAVRYIMYL